MDEKAPPGGGRKMAWTWRLLALAVAFLVVLRLWPGLWRAVVELGVLARAGLRSAVGTPLALLVPLVLGLAVFLAFRRARARRRRRGPPR